MISFPDALKKLADEDRRANGQAKVALRSVADALNEKVREHEQRHERVRREIARGAHLTKHRITL